MSETVKPESVNPHDTMTLDDTELGDIRIHEGVIASIARKAALGIPGVSRLAGSSLVDNLAEIVGSRRMQSRNITITLSEDNNVAIEIKVVFRFGFRIPDVSTEIQKAVIREVENTTGMNVVRVHIIVQDIEDAVVKENTPAELPDNPQA
ncbi:MAG: Asp23/Gls24 family envelope stress response protein [Lentisphaerae bacterium]|nr:Asp23/Gls24 family envelope stress response protein [Lentisphaerota bacterium]